MPMLPLRGLGKAGIITDASPVDLPPGAFSAGNNVAFDEGKVKRAPVFRTLYDAIKSTLSYDDPTLTDTYDATTGTYADIHPLTGGAATQRYVCSFRDPSSSNDTILVADDDGTVRGYSNGTLVDYTPSTGFTRTLSEAQWTSCVCNSVLYLNRETQAPYALLPGSTAFEVLPNWPAATVANVIRTFGDFVVAFDVTKSGVRYPNMMKWSDATQPSAVPATWDPADTTANAGERTFTTMQRPVLDALELGGTMIVYASDQTHIVEQTSDTFIFDSRVLFSDRGIISTNCVVEVDRKHYVFGVNDIYVHDGISAVSICDQRTREFIFSGMVRKNAQHFFVAHNEITNELEFCYTAADINASFPGTAFCNRSAVFNYRQNTWSFKDLPNVIGAALANSVPQSTYETVNGVYDTAGGAYGLYEDDSTRVLTMLGVTDTANGLTDTRLYGVDRLTNSRLTYPLEVETVKPAFVERTGLDLDNIPIDQTRTFNLRGVKVVRGLYPQMRVMSDSSPVTFNVGAAEYPSGTVYWEGEQTFDPTDEYKVDSRQSGRYLAYRVTVADAVDFEFTGFDADVASLGGE